MTLTTKTTGRWPPDWNGNLEAPANERVYVTVEYPDNETRAELKSTESSAAILKDSEEEEKKPTRAIIIKTHFDRKRICCELTPKIEGLNDKLDGKLQAIKDGAMLWKCRNPKTDVLIDLIVARVMGDEIPEDQEKNSEPPSTS